MSIDIAKPTTSIVENACRWILSPSLLSSSSTSISSGVLALKQPHHKQDGVLWMWTALGLSVYGLRLCKNALELYWVSLAWNRRRNRRNESNDEHELGPTKRSVEKRKVQIERALTTMTFGQLQKQISESGDCCDRGKNEHADTKQTTNEGPQNENGSTNPSTLSSSCTTTTMVLHPPLEKTCVICLEDFENDDRISFSNSGCKHIFHTECLQAWLEKHTSCPTCRNRMLPDPEPMPWLLVPNR